MRNILLLGWMAFSPALAQGQPPPFPAPSDLERTGLKGPVREVHSTLRLQTPESFGQFIVFWQERATFNRQGYAVSSEVAMGNTLQRLRRRLDARGWPLEVRYEWGAETYTYPGLSYRASQSDAKGLIREESCTLTPRSLKERCVAEDYRRGIRWEERYTYNARGQETFYWKTTTRRGDAQPSSETRRWTAYDTQGRRTQQRERFEGGPVWEEKVQTWSEFDAQGNPTRSTSQVIGKDGQIREQADSALEYEYDARGNWIKIAVYSLKGNEKVAASVTERTITYYP